MAFVITKDLIENGSAVGTVGPSGCEMTAKQIGTHPEAQAFEMYDDDRELYYRGFYLDTDDDAEGEFEPLDCFGMPNAGCTGIRYRDSVSGKFEWL